MTTDERPPRLLRGPAVRVTGVPRPVPVLVRPRTVPVAVAPAEVAIAPAEVAVAPAEVAVAPAEVAVAPAEVAVVPAEVAVAPAEVEAPEAEDSRPTAQLEAAAPAPVKQLPHPRVEMPDDPPDREEPPPREPDPPPPPGPRPSMRMASQICALVALLALGLLVQITLLGGLRHDRDQAQAFAALRQQLADGTAPVGPLDDAGVPLAAGTPVAVLDIPQINLHEVVLEAATSRVTMSGPAHRRDTPLPGQVGTSLVLGRRGGYSGPFAELDRLQIGDRFRVTTGQGQHDFTVIAVRRAGDPMPTPLKTGGGRLTLITTDGPVFRPTDVLRVDADLTTDVQERPPQLPAGAAPTNEKFFAGDPTALLPLLLWSALLAGAAVVTAWLRHRVGRPRAWVIGVPVLLLLGTLVLDDAAALLPNLL